VIPPQEIIRRKRDGHALSDAEIATFIADLTTGAVTEGQAAAFAMAVFFRGMTPAECVALTDAMTRSGKVLDWSREGLNGPVLDKHSTGGVGDNVSLMLAPMIAACGGFVPMISGRGLGHTGGTLDKLDSIPGYNATPDEATFRRVVKTIGCAIIGQTDDLAPADRRLYAIRDVTATVESIPLITASILSKKRAAGLDGLVMDVKTGSGAFMRETADARALAESIVGVAAGAGLPTTALLTDMNEPLASAAGAAVEVDNAIAYLTGARRDPRLHEVTMALGVEMLMLGGLASSRDDAATKLTRALDGGAAAETFERMVHALGGPSNILTNRDVLPRGPVTSVVESETPGFITAIDTRAIGLVVLALGGGRTRSQDAIDHSVGLSDFARLGDALSVGAPLCRVHARDRDSANAAARAIRAAVTISPAPPVTRPTIIERICSA
jgi:thymidine phosphorylase